MDESQKPQNSLGPTQANTGSDNNPLTPSDSPAVNPTPEIPPPPVEQDEPPPPEISPQNPPAIEPPTASPEPIPGPEANPAQTPEPLSQQRTWGGFSPPRDVFGSPDTSAPIIPPIIPSPPKKRVPKALFGIAAFLLLVLSIPAGIFLVQRQQELRKSAQEGARPFQECSANIGCFDTAPNLAYESSEDPKDQVLYCRKIGSSTEEKYMWVTQSYSNAQCSPSQQGRVAECGGETWVCRGNAQGDWVQQVGVRPGDSCSGTLSCGTTAQNSVDPSQPLYCRDLGSGFKWTTQAEANAACNSSTKNSIARCGGEEWRCDGNTWQRDFDPAQNCEGSLIPICGPYPDNKLNVTWNITPVHGCNVFIQANQQSYRVNANDSDCSGSKTITEITGTQPGNGPITNDGIYQLVLSNGDSATNCYNKVVQDARLACQGPQTQQPSINSIEWTTGDGLKINGQNFGASSGSVWYSRGGSHNVQANLAGSWSATSASIERSINDPGEFNNLIHPGNYLRVCQSGSTVCSEWKAIPERPSGGLIGQCTAIKIYDTTGDPGNLLTTEILARSYKAGDRVRLALVGTNAEKARFRMTGRPDWVETTNKNSRGEFYIEAPLPSGQSLTIEGELFKNGSWF